MELQHGDYSRGEEGEDDFVFPVCEVHFNQTNFTSNHLHQRLPKVLTEVSLAALSNDPSVSQWHKTE